MTYSKACIRCAHLASAAVVTAALAVGLAGPPPVHVGTLSIENHLVQLQAAAVGTVTNNPVFDDVSPAAPVDTAITAAAMDGSAAASATGDFADTLVAVGHALATAAGWALAPIWYLAFPVTTIMWDVVIAPLFFPDYPKMWGIPFFAMFPTSWFVPFRLDDILFSTVLSSTASPSSASARPAATVGAGSAATVGAGSDEPAASPAATAPAPRRGGQALRDNGSVRATSRPVAAGPAAAKPAATGAVVAANPAAAEPQRSAKSDAVVQSPVGSKTDSVASKKSSAARS